jgi:hypothetical protein
MPKGLKNDGISFSRMMAKVLKYVVVAVEYFSRRIEAKALATMTLGTIKKFF